jgi:outer membrane scaffolding protein for murein synthesis (MipA/OmpV family)
MHIQARGGACAALLIALAAGPAAADGARDLFGDRWQAGGFVYVSPSFEGSKSYDAIAFPFIAPAGIGSDGVLQIKGADDVRWRLFQSGGFEAGPLAGYRFGRDGDDVHNVPGLDDVDGGLVLGAFATYRTGPLAFSVSYHHQVTGDDTGGLIRFGVEHTARLSPTVKLTTGVGTNYATQEYMTAFFGVPGGPHAYDPDAGFKDVYVGATASIDLSDRWSLLLIGRYSHLIGDAADSPIVETESQLYGGLALSYKFDWGR